MDEFFEIFDIAKKHYGMTRLVHVDFEEAYIRVYLDDKAVVRVDGTYDELEELYIQAAARLLTWIKQREIA